jgi:Arc/MetJ-type ribon-helix-helix transcriptional regulator
MRKREQISVPLPEELREFVERQAEAEYTSAASIVRRIIAAEQRRAQAEQEAA